MSNLIERAVARAAAKVGGVQASIRGLHGVFKRLTEEHKEMALLLQRLAIASDIEKRATIWPSVRDELIAHEQAESQEVYADFSWHPSLVELVYTHEEDASKLQAFVRQLDGLTFDSPQWHPTLLKLEAIMNAHAEREDELLFPQVQSIIGKDRAEELDSRYVATKNAIHRAA
jgi:hemerythrin-like domain-containing protein